jgi:hypothetical protein
VWNLLAPLSDPRNFKHIEIVVAVWDLLAYLPTTSLREHSANMQTNMLFAVWNLLAPPSDPTKFSITFETFVAVGDLKIQASTVYCYQSKCVAV